MYKYTYVYIYVCVHIYVYVHVCVVCVHDVLHPVLGVYGGGGDLAWFFHMRVKIMILSYETSLIHMRLIHMGRDYF